MRTLAAILILAAVSALHANRTTLPDGADKPAVPPEAQQVLDAIRAADTGHLAVSEEAGRLLRPLIPPPRPGRVLEIGGARGYSGSRSGLGLRQTGAGLVTLEYDAERARDAAG